MFVVFVLLGAAVLFGAVMVVLGRGDLLDPDVQGRGERLLPDGAVAPGDLEGLRFAIVQRGYRMDQVDAVLDRVEGELVRRDERIAELESRLPGGSGAVTPPVVPSGRPLPRRHPVWPETGTGADETRTDTADIDRG